MKEYNEKKSVVYDFAVYVDTRSSKQLTLAHDLTVSIAKNYSSFLVSIEKAFSPILRIKIFNIDTGHDFCSFYRISISIIKEKINKNNDVSDLIYSVLKQSLEYKGMVDSEQISKIIIDNIVVKLLGILDFIEIESDYLDEMYQSISKIIKLINNTSYLISSKKFWSNKERETQRNIHKYETIDQLVISSELASKSVVLENLALKRSKDRIC